MGAAVSEPVSHKDLQDKTIRTRALMDVILQYMLNQISIKDFAALSNPTECKKYVIFMANNLFQYFHKIRVLPILDNRGFMAFRRMEDLQSDQDKMTREQEAKKQSLCLTLSYFYTRIFQIYGALALTLIDDVQYMGSTGAINLGASEYLPTPGTVPHPIGRPRPKMGGGGPGPKDLGNFYFLTSILQQNMEQMGYTVLHDTYGKTKDEIYFKAIDKEKKGADDSAQEGRFAISYPGIYDYARWYITAARIPSTSEIRVTFGELTYTDQKGQSHSIDPPADVVTKKEIRLSPDPNLPSEYKVIDPSLSAGQYMKARFRKMLEYVKKLAGTKSSTATTTATTTSDSFSDTGVDPKLALERVRSNLTKDKPPGHCVARALQLLRTPVLSGQDGVSHICKIQFYETTKGPTRAGLPSPGGLLTATTRDAKPGSASMAAFSQLFYDVVSTGTPKLIIGIKKGAAGQPSSFEQYTRFMRLMSHVFEDNMSAAGKERTDEELQELGLDELRNKRDEKKCAGVTPGDLAVSADVAQKVQKVVLELFKIQFHHANECGKIMGMLFDIKYNEKKDPTEIGFSANLLKRGFPELEKINYLAREILLKYYARCEGTYQEGMNMVLDDHKKRRAVAAKAALGVQAAQVQAPQVQAPQSRDSKGQLLAPGATQAVVQPTAPPAPTLNPTLSAPIPTGVAPAKTKTKKAQYANTLAKSYPGNWGGGTRKRSSHHTVTSPKR